MEGNKLFIVYQDALKEYELKGIKVEDKRISHITRLFRYAVELKRMDFISKNCLNPVFREVLLKNGFDKSIKFMDLAKEYFKNDLLWFDEGKVCFKQFEGVSQCLDIQDCENEKLKGGIEQNA